MPSRPSNRCRGPSAHSSARRSAATLAKSQEDRGVFDLVFDRWFFRAAEMEALERADEEGAEGGSSSSQDGR